MVWRSSLINSFTTISVAEHEEEEEEEEEEII
jgi:hypothetical protein